MSNIAFLMDWAEIVDLGFGLIHQNIFIKKAFIPLLRVAFFFKKIASCDEILIFIE